MTPQFVAALIGAFVSSGTAVTIALYSLVVARRSRKADTTRDLLRRYFSSEFTLVRREALSALIEFWKIYKDKGDLEHSALMQYLISRRLDEYVFTTDRGSNGLSSKQCSLLVLYFWAELQAYRSRKAVDDDLIREILVSQWDFHRDVLVQIALTYGKVYSVDSEVRRLSVPPWVDAVKQVDAWMGTSHDLARNGS